MWKKPLVLRNSYCVVCKCNKLHEFGNWIVESPHKLIPYKECIKCGEETKLDEEPKRGGSRSM